VEVVAALIGAGVGVLLGAVATFALSLQLDRYRAQENRKLRARLLKSEVEANQIRLQSEGKPKDNPVPQRLYQKEIYHRLLPDWGLFNDSQRSQILDFYHSLMLIEYHNDNYDKTPKPDLAKPWRHAVAAAKVKAGPLIGMLEDAGRAASPKDDESRGRTPLRPPWNKENMDFP